MALQDVLELSPQYVVLERNNDAVKTVLFDVAGFMEDNGRAFGRHYAWQQLRQLLSDDILSCDQVADVYWLSLGKEDLFEQMTSYQRAHPELSDPEES